MADDYRSDTFTSGRVLVDGSISGQIESGDDQDWFGVSLTAGRRYSFSLNTVPAGGGLVDPYLSLFSSAGVLLGTDDDSGPGLDSLLTYTPNSSGTFYLGSKSYVGGGIGAYTLSVSVAHAPVRPVYRFAKVSDGTYFLSGDQQEYESIIRNYPDFRPEGAGFFANADLGTGVSVYRFANIRNGGYFFTADPGERDTVIATRSTDMRYEGSSFSVVAQDTFGSVPVYRLANTISGAYLYTVNSAEVNAARTLGFWRYEGIAFFAPSATNGPTTLSIAAQAADKAEGSSAGSGTPYTFMVSRTGDSLGSATVNYLLGSQQAGSVDFLGNIVPSGTVSFAPGEAAKTITILVAQDTVVESDESFTVTLSSPVSASLGTSSAVGFIRNDDVQRSPSVLSIVAQAADKPEGSSAGSGTPYTFVVSRTGDSSGSATVNYLLGSQQAGSVDFLGNIVPSGTVSFAPGEAAKTITILVAQDTVVESDESFTVTLSSPVSASLGTSSAVGFIRNDDVQRSPSVLSIVAQAADKPEGSSAGSGTPYTFVVSRTGDSSGSATVNYLLGSQQANSVDFLGNIVPSGTVSFAPGEAVQIITILVAQDTVVESDESFTVTLSSPVSASLGTSSAVGFIRNDDVQRSPSVLSIVAQAADKPEGSSAGSGTPYTFVVSRTGDSSGSATVNYLLGSQQANSVDFLGNIVPSGTVSFAPGEAVQIITILVAQDTVVESDESFTVTLSSPVSASLGTSSAVGFIRNDDEQGTPGSSSSYLQHSDFASADRTLDFSSDGTTHVSLLAAQNMADLFLA